ncbi:MAG: RNA-binding transcriptional accessory protein [Ruminococcaceae bacterium]|nr:RNA-binding transcriptional accessory protein [Oscillospiraceae bacterium]
MNIIAKLAEELKFSEEHVTRAVEMLDEGNTVPFIARYRKEVTGSMDDDTLRTLEDRLRYLRNLDERRAEIISSIEGQEKMTPELLAAIEKAETQVALEDLYLPYRPKRKTRASVARERGLEPLAEIVTSEPEKLEESLEALAEAYVNEENGLPDVTAVLAGVSDIIAEDISTTAEYRQMLRTYLSGDGTIKAAAAKEEDSVYADYYEYSEPITKMRPHRILALNRGEKEGFLKVDLAADETVAVGKLCTSVTKNPASPVTPFIHAAAADSYSRLIFPSLEREIRSELFDAAAEGALKVFGENLKNLLLIAPVKGKTVLGFDPGYAHGCKLAVVDKTGKYLTSTVIYPTKPREDIARASKTLLDLIRKYKVDIIAIGNGTASRESEKFVADLIRENSLPVAYTIVSESGASVYSATKLAQEEFPDLDVNERSAVSIARRLQDPLAELVKVDPMAIGVGQYQHDMNPKRLAETLGGVVEDCVNSVGVDLNTASASLLSYVSGINKTIAKNIVAYREENGEFKSRAKLLKVPKLGAKAYEQCAGFLRVVGGEEILDNTGVHPESYSVAKALLARFGYTEEDVRGEGMKLLRFKAEQAGVSRLAEELGCGEPTLLDIIGELEKPGRDIRDDAPAPVLRTDVLEMKDLVPDMVLRGTVRNVVDFGCFVDIGVHEDGLLHVSEMSDRRFVKHPRELFSVGDVIEVKIKAVDMQRKRISLTRKGLSEAK